MLLLRWFISLVMNSAYNASELEYSIRKTQTVFPVRDNSSKPRKVRFDTAHFRKKLGWVKPNVLYCMHDQDLGIECN